MILNELNLLSISNIQSSREVEDFLNRDVEKTNINESYMSLMQELNIKVQKIDNTNETTSSLKTKKTTNAVFMKSKKVIRVCADSRVSK